MLLNIFFGIIIDTFGKLRNLKLERELNESNKCFICGVERHDFMKKYNENTSNVTMSFHHHRKVVHNMWNYLYFAMHIWQQNINDDNSVELYVRKCLEKGDIYWFPIGIYDSNSTHSEVMLETKHENMNNIRADNSVTTNPNIMKSEYENLMESVRFINEKIDKLSQTNEIMSANNKTNNFTNKIDLNNILESVNTNVKNEISIIKSDITSISDRLDALELCK